MNIYKYDYQLNMMLNNDPMVDTRLYREYLRHDPMRDSYEDAMFQENHRMLTMFELVLLNRIKIDELDFLNKRNKQTYD